jgi:hypothetical protein
MCRPLQPFWCVPIYRRRSKQLHPGHPDRLHFHSLVKQRYVRRWFCRLSGDARNSVTGLMIGAMTLTAVLMASLVYNSRVLSAATFVVMTLGYVTLYARMVRYHWCSPVKFLLVRPVRARSLPSN